MGTIYCYISAKQIYICFRLPGTIHVVPLTGSKCFVTGDFDIFSYDVLLRSNNVLYEF